MPQTGYLMPSRYRNHMRIPAQRASYKYCVPRKAFKNRHLRPPSADIKWFVIPNTGGNIIIPNRSNDGTYYITVIVNNSYVFWISFEFWKRQILSRKRSIIDACKSQFRIMEELEKVEYTDTRPTMSSAPRAMVSSFHNPKLRFEKRIT